MLRFISALGILALAGCPEAPTLNGSVQDVFGKPIEGATVVMDGVTEQSVSDPQGKFSFPLQQSNMRLMAGKEGFIKVMSEVEPPSDPKAPVPTAVLSLHKAPAGPGFHAVAATEYAALPGQKLETKGTELKSVTGFKEPGTVKLSKAKPLSFLFSTTLRKSEIAQMNLQLHRMEFVEKASAKGVLGAEDVTLNLWVAKGTVPFDLEAMQTDGVYLIQTREALASGIYAFHPQGVLTSTDLSALDKLPKELQVAYTFEVP